MEIASEMRQAIRSYKPIEAEGLTLYPVKVAEYEDFLRVRPAIEFMQQSLPANCISLPLLSALYKLDYEAIAKKESASGMFMLSAAALLITLRIGQGEPLTERLKRLEVVCYPNEPSRLKRIAFRLDGEEKVTVTPVAYQTLRPIIAAQNGIEIYADDVNPDLVAAERDIAAQKAPKLDFNIDDLIASISALSGVDECEIVEWPILKMENRQKAFKRIMDYMIAGVGEMQGTKWKGGNPHPSPWFAREKETSGSLMPLEDFAGGAGVNAMQQSGALPPE